MKNVAILGSTGSIGCNALDVIRYHSERFRVFALAARSNWQKLAEQVVEFQPRIVVLTDETQYPALKQALIECGLPRPSWPEIYSGQSSLVAAATAPEVDIVLSAIVGIAGLEATYRAALAGKRIALANKETLVAGGSLVMKAVKTAGAQLVPVDSEHSAALQCLLGHDKAQVDLLYLTASGGPFRETPLEELAKVTAEQALCHPTWRMGPRITIDSATLMNKGFEVIEACWLFELALEQVRVLIHPQSKVHAMIRFKDGSLLAQIAATDMRIPIQFALTYPERLESPTPPLDWSEAVRWEFYPPDFKRFPLLKLAYEAFQHGASATCVLNAADEVAVAAFLAGEISFPQIAAVVEETMQRGPTSYELSSLDVVFQVDAEARQLARSIIAELSGK